MTFNSYTFALFFLCVLVVYYILGKWKMRKQFLLITSYMFYAAWNPPFVILLWISTFADWQFSQFIAYTDKTSVKRIFLLGSLFVNLGLLGFFKYGNFILENSIYILKTLGINQNFSFVNILLPVGISFYTFQTLSYTLDVYFGKIKHWHSFLDYALYVTFFPQLVAGPIVRADEFLQQCEYEKPLVWSNISWGFSLITLGLFEKVVVADALLAPVTESLYSVSGTPTFTAAWVGTLAFTGQIFGDFAGYSTCAIGTAICLGFTLPRNFHFPYAAVGFSDFWRRWHISLSTWLRDYLYIPLGGNRVSNFRNQINLMITMLLGGLWHGAAWSFVVWGGVHGIYLIVERYLKKTFGHQAIWQSSGMRLLLGLLTFILTCLTWVLFRASSLTQATNIITSMLHFSSQAPTIDISNGSLLKTIAIIFSMLGIHWLFRDKSLEEITHKSPWWITSIALAVMLYAIATLHAQDRSFIYFQF